MDPHKALWEFHAAFDLVRSNAPELPSKEIRELRKSLLEEEWTEYLEGEQADDIVEIADALADIIYIAYGTAVAYGIPMDRVFAEVHRSNMSKLGEDGKPIYRDDGKVLKPSTWSPPDIRGILGKG